MKKLTPIVPKLMPSSFLSLLNMFTTAPTSESVIPVVVSSAVPRSCAVCHTTGHDKRNCPSKPSATAATASAAATEPVTAPTPSVITETTPRDWLMRVGDGVDFDKSSKHNTWGAKSLFADGKHFLKHARPGDHLWFVKAKTKPYAQLIRVATLVSSNKRETGPCVAVTRTDEELGWTRGNEYDTEIHYKDLYNVEQCELYSEIEGTAVIRLYNEKCKVNLPKEYPYIVRYSKAQKL